MIYKEIKKEDASLYKLMGETFLSLGLVLYYRLSGFSPRSYLEKLFSYHYLGVRVVLPNAKGRAWNIRFHDLHHVLSGILDVTWLFGEALISFFELGAGCLKSGPGVFFNLNNSFLGYAFSKETRRLAFSEFLRGRRSTSLYGGQSQERLQSLMGRRIEDIRRELNILPPGTKITPTLADRGWFALTLLAGFVSSVIFFVVTVLLGFLFSFIFWVISKLGGKELDFGEQAVAHDQFPEEIQRVVKSLRDMVRSNELAASFRSKLHVLLTWMCEHTAEFDKKLRTVDQLRPIFFPKKKTA